MSNDTSYFAERVCGKWGFYDINDVSERECEMNIHVNDMHADKNNFVPKDDPIGFFFTLVIFIIICCLCYKIVEIIILKYLVYLFSKIKEEYEKKYEKRREEEKEDVVVL